MFTLKLTALLASTILAGCRSPEATTDEATLASRRASVEQDCNGNGVEDAVDISFGSSSDANNNGIPDECEAAVAHRISP